MIECPANYFGRGEDYILPDDPDVVREFERKFEEWVNTHPDDPTGEQTLKAHGPQRTHRSILNRSPKGIFINSNSETPAPPTKEKEPYVLMGEIKLRLPIKELETLKNFAIFKRRRPRDIICRLINENCQIGT